MDLGFKPFNPWPIFNMADVYITIGIAVILLDMALHPQRQQSAVKEISEMPHPAPKEQNGE
jgi:lipoprotein signal peptidase